MSSDGIVVVIANIDTNKNKLLGNPNITTRGFVLIQENLDLIKELEVISTKAILSKIEKHVNYSEIKSEISNQLSTYIYEKTGRNPIILPVIMDIKK
jgi:ribonuclease J